MRKNNYKFCIKLWSTVLFVSVSVNAKFDPNTAIFLVPSVGNSPVENTYITLPNLPGTISTSDNEYVINFPVKQDDGTYKLVEVKYTENDTTRTITIPGQGDVNLIKDEDGNYNFTLTPEQINDSSNVKCTVGITGDGTCTIEPFVSMVGNKILTADKLVVDYKEGENLVVAGGQATNLKLVEPGATTDIKKSETLAGDSIIQVKFAKEESTNSNSLDIPFIPGITKTPSTLKNQKNMEISLNTSMLTHTVTNPNNPNDSRVKFKVNDAGVSSRLLINNQDHLKIEFDAQTAGGISYNSDPFSDKSVKVESTSPVNASLRVDNDPTHPMSTLNIVVAGLDKNGEKSVLTVVDNRDTNSKNSVTSYGETVINLSQATKIDEKTLKVADSNAPVAFEIGSDHLIVKQEKLSGKVTESEIKGVHAIGDSSKNGDKRAVVTANSISILKTTNGKLDQEITAGDVKYAMLENSNEKKQLAMLDHAYYNNGETKLNLSGGALVSVDDYKKSQTALTFDGKPVKKDTLIIGNSANIDNSGATANIDGGVTIRELQFFDKSKLTTIAGSSAGFSAKEYQLSVADGFSAVNLQDSKGDPVYTKVSAANISGKNKDDFFKVTNSQTSGEVIGKTTTGKDIIDIRHTSSGLEYKTGDGKQIANLEGLNVSAIEADKIKYGQASFKNLKIQDNKNGKSQSLEVVGAEAAFYSDESDPTKKIRSGEMSLEKLGLKNLDYSVDVIAKDANGQASKYKIIFNEDGDNKSYKIFAEDGNRVFLDGKDKDNRHANVLFESVEYFQDNKFKSILAKNISGNLQTINSSDSKLQSFNVARVEGVQSLDGNFKQFSLTDASVSQVIPGKEEIALNTGSAFGVSSKVNGVTTNQGYLKNGNVTFLKTDDKNSAGSINFNSIEGVQVKTIDGKKESYIKGEGLSGQLREDNQTLSFNDLNVMAIEADKIKYGQASFKNLKIQDNKNGENQSLEVVRAEAAFYSDESDPTKKIRSGEMSLEKLGLKNLDYSVDVIAKDASGQASKYKNIFNEDGDNKSYKIFAEDGSRVFLDGKDKDNRHANVLFESVEYFQDNKFKSILAKNISGNLQTINSSDSKLQSFNVARVEGVQSLDGNFKQFSLTDASVSQVIPGKEEIVLSTGSAFGVSSKVNGVTTNQGVLKAGSGSYLKSDGKNTQGSFNFNSLEAALTKGADGNKESYIKGDGFNLEASDSNKNATVSNLNFTAQESGKVRLVNANFSNLSISENKKLGQNENVQILGAQVAFYEDEKIKYGQASIDKLKFKSADYSVDVIAKDSMGIPSKFKIMIFEEGNLKQYKIYAEDGKQVDIDGVDSKNNYAKVLFDSIEYLQDDKFKQVIATNISGKYETISASDKKLYTFNSAKLEGLQSIDGKSKYLSAQEVKLAHSDASKSQTTFDVKSATFSESNYLDTKELSGAMYNGVVNYVEYKDPKKGLSSGTKTDAKISFGSFLASQITKPNNEKITVVSAKDLDIVAVDYNEFIKLNGQIGGVDFFEDSNIQTIQVSDLKNFNLEDMKSGVQASFDAKRILRVVNKDENGKETGSYLLVNSAFLNAKDPKNGINANIKVGVLEIFQDKLNKQNIILDADISGKITIDKTKSPIAGQVDFAFKGKHLTTESHKFISADGNTVSNYFAIKPVDGAGRLDHLKLEAGPSFLKDAISLEAKGGPNGGKTLSFTFEQDKAKGTYFVRAEFKEGEKVKIKLFPFTLESKMEGADAVAELLLTPKGQNFMNHMEIISNVVSENEITSWLGISNGGMLVARTGTLGGFGFELMYQNEDFFDPGSIQTGMGNKDKAQTVGAGIFHKNSKGDRTSAGIMLSGDSEIAYQTNGRGVLKIFGVDMAKSGSIPSTINLYMKKDYADGDSIYGGVFVDAASFLVDEKRLSKDAAFYDGNRGMGKIGASMAYSKKLDSSSRLTLALGVNNNFSSPAVCLTYTKTFGGSTPSKPVIDLSKKTMEVLNKYTESMPVRSTASIMSGPSVQGAIGILEGEVKNLELQYEEAKVIAKVKLALTELLAAIDNKTLTPQNADRKFNLTQEDLEIFKRVEAKNFRSAKVSYELENIANMVRYDVTLRSGVGRVSDYAQNIRESMKQMTKNYKETDSSEIFDQYSAKLAELSKLSGY